MPVDHTGQFEWAEDGSKIRRITPSATIPEGNVQGYDKWNPINGTTHGARLVDRSTGRTIVHTDDHESQSAAADWILRALGYVAPALLVVIVLAVAIAMIVIGMTG